MICPFCGAVVEKAKLHMDWHRDLGVNSRASGIWEIHPTMAALSDPQLVCHCCGEPAKWEFYGDHYCDFHIYERI